MSTKGFAAVLHRMKLIAAVTTDADLSSALDVSPQTLSSWKGRNSIPYSYCIDLAIRHGISLDWLLLGEGQQQRAPCPEDTTQRWEEQLLARVRGLAPQDQQAIANAVEEKQRIRQLERQVEEMYKQLQAAR